MEELIAQYNLTQEDLTMLLEWFGSDTMSGVLRSMHKSPSRFYWDDSEEDEFPTYELWKLSGKMRFDLNSAKNT